jgi:hypothetical protein
MAHRSANPDEILKFWRELKETIKSNMTLGQVYDRTEIIDYVLEDGCAREALTEALEQKENKGLIIDLARSHGLKAEDLE